MYSTTVEPPENVEIIRAVSAEEMFQAVTENLPETTIFIGTAAVADYRPKNVAQAKIKKTNQDFLTLELEKTPDILSNVSQNRHNGLLVVGFAAETNDVVNYARSKMEKKNLDLIVANDVTPDLGVMGGEDNTVHLVTADNVETWPTLDKDTVARRLVARLAEMAGARRR